MSDKAVQGGKPVLQVAKQIACMAYNELNSDRAMSPVDLERIDRLVGAVEGYLRGELKGAGIDIRM